MAPSNEHPTCVPGFGAVKEAVRAGLGAAGGGARNGCEGPANVGASRPEPVDQHQSESSTNGNRVLRAGFPVRSLSASSSSNCLMAAFCSRSAITRWRSPRANRERPPFFFRSRAAAFFFASRDLSSPNSKS